MIIHVEGPLPYFPKILSMSTGVKNVDGETLRPLLYETMKREDGLILVSVKDGVVGGFIIATVENWQGEDVVFIQLCVINPDHLEKYTGFTLLAEVRLFAKDKGLKTIMMSTPRSPKGYMRKYKFSLEGYILKRSVTDE